MQEGGAAARKEGFLQATGGLSTIGQHVDSPKPRAYREVQTNIWEELYCVQTDKCDKTKKCQADCPTCRVKVQRFRRSTKGGFGDLQKP